VVYLKNGSVIKGVIIEQVPDVSLKIKTSDGSLIVCQMNEVDRIAKEERPSYRDLRKSARNTLKGYKGFIDAATIGNVNGYDASFMEISTTHGYQFNNYFFLGGGIALNYYADAELTTAPIYAAFRANFINKKVSPFADIKLGYTVGDLRGTYASIGIGVRFSLKGRKALNLACVYSEQDNEWYSDNSVSYLGLGVRFGFEF